MEEKQQTFISSSELEYWKTMAESLRNDNFKLREKLSHVLEENKKLKEDNRKL